MNRIATDSITSVVLLLMCVWGISAGCSHSAESRDVLPGDAALEAGRDSASNEQAVEGPGRGRAALESASAAGKYLFVLFHKNDDAATQARRKAFAEATERLADRADRIEIDVASPAERDWIARYGLDGAPMPLVLAFAPNGAVTAGFPDEFTASDLETAFVSPAAQQCMKHLQDGKLVFVCVQGESTQGNDEAMAGVQQFLADGRYGANAEAVLLDPADGAEAALLEELEVDPKTPTATTVFLVPPGSRLAQFTGATTKQQFIAELEKASARCSGGNCGPGGCGPR